MSVTAPLMAKSPVDAQINQNITATIILLKMLTTQANQKLIYTPDLGTLQDQVNAMRNQMNTITEECNATEVAICLLHTELVQARNVTNALVHNALLLPPPPPLLLLLLLPPLLPPCIP